MIFSTPARVALSAALFVALGALPAWLGHAEFLGFAALIALGALAWGGDGGYSAG